jgi:hypothetical protein
VRENEPEAWVAELLPVWKVTLCSTPPELHCQVTVLLGDTSKVPGLKELFTTDTVRAAPPSAGSVEPPSPPQLNKATAAGAASRRPHFIATPPVTSIADYFRLRPLS